MIDFARRPASSSMEEVSAWASTLTEEVRAPTVTKAPQEAHAEGLRASPPQSALRADSSSIEEEQSLTFKVFAQ